MNSEEKYQDDLLRKYLGPLQIEKAPEGFTPGIMREVEAEASLKGSAAHRTRVSLVPFIFAIVFSMLVVSLVLIPGKVQDNSFPDLLSVLRKIDWKLPSIELNSLFSYNAGNLVFYIIAGIAMLTLFDKALRLLFHNGR